MIQNFVKLSLKEKDGVQGRINISQKTKRSFVLSYPCEDSNKCTPYVLKLSSGVYRFECWGSRGGDWESGSSRSTPGLGGYTAGTLFLQNPTTMYVYIGTVGFFNGIKEYEKQFGGVYATSGGATDVRLKTSDNWWDSSSLISRIMVSGGGGGAEWGSSYGGHGGGIEGGTSISNNFQLCKGGTQTSGSQCDSIQMNLTHNQVPITGTFGSGGKTILQNPTALDYGGFGGGGYYGGTSYPWAYAGSGGSSFISGFQGCNAVKEQTDVIVPKNDPIHYSRHVFVNPIMIQGNNTMPLPSSFTEKSIYKGIGAFRISLLFYCHQCTEKIRNYSQLSLFLLFVFYK